MGTDPDAAYTNFQASRASLKENAAERFKQVLKLTAELGVSKEEGIEFARERAAETYAEDLELLRLKYPFTDNLVAAQRFKMTGKIDTPKKELA